MEKPCPEPETLARYLEGSLAADERLRVTGHLADCDGCRRTVSLASSLEAVPAAPVNEILLGRVVSASRRRRFLPMAIAAAVMLIGIVSISLLRSSRQDAPTALEAEERPRPVLSLSRPPSAEPSVKSPPPPPPAPAAIPVPERPPLPPGPVVVSPKEDLKPLPPPP
ncbi:MAG TPA: zf-HC2 domain-containing protein, partial [Planctomycetota bacterium]|nr:zf-HC2 domain-containing protein [Planctomycetota bacterium]